MLSQTAEYALEAVAYLAEHARGAPVPAEAIAEALDLPRNYLSKTLHTLTLEGVVSSSRGPGGGFELALPPESLPLVRVIGPFDDLARRPHYLLGRPECAGDDDCSLHGRWQAVVEPLAAFFRDTTVEDLVGSGRSV